VVEVVDANVNGTTLLALAKNGNAYIELSQVTFISLLKRSYRGTVSSIVALIIMDER
jgi:hypothetical protein